MYKNFIKHPLMILFVIITVVSVIAQTPQAAAPITINAHLRSPFRFVAYGDTRFTDPADTKAADPAVRQQLVRAIADAQPDFITFGGDIAYSGDKVDDWKVFDHETAVWRERKIPVYPALGNHDLHGDLNTALGNYFARFPDLQKNRFYAVQLPNSVMLTLDSALNETTGPQGDWLRSQLEHLPSTTDFVFIVMHHPPYTSSSDDKTFGGGHSARSPEQKMAVYLEEQQKKLRARIIVFAGHVHNYERHQHGGITYFVSGGGGAHAYPITRAKDDLFQSTDVNYHYLMIEVQPGKAKVTMNRLEMKDGVAKWSQPDSTTILAETPAEGKMTKQLVDFQLRPK